MRLPYGLDVWAPNKVLNIEWDAQGKVVLVSLHRGDWEAELMALAQSLLDHDMVAGSKQEGH
jgi:hypothetical protein